MRRVLPYFIVGLTIVSAIGWFFLIRSKGAAPIFEDVTPYSGISYLGMTYGAAWGDFDSDGLPDLYVTNHLNSAKLYRNIGKGRFSDVTDRFFSRQDLLGDKHGAAWADFDNDGHQDLIQLTGAARGVGSEPKRLFLNRGTRFEEIARMAGVSNLLGRTRMPLWFDFNSDGQLDLFQGAETRLDNQSAPFTYLQQEGKFAATDDTLKFASWTAPFCIITSLKNDNHSNLVCRVSAHNRTAQIFDITTQPPRELDLLPPSAFEDVAAGDFDNDGLIDLFMARKNPVGPVAFGQPGSNEIIADTWIDQTNVGKPAGFSFRSSGRLTMRVTSVRAPDGLAAEQIHIGKRGGHPSDLVFTVSSETGGIKGTAPYHPGQRVGVYVGLTPPDQWQIFVSGASEIIAGGNLKPQQIAIKVTSSESISDLTAIGDSVKPEEAPARLFMNRSGKLVEESKKRGVNARPVAAVNVVAGDFDNDMDLDLFVVGSGEIGKQKNLLLLNRGDGHFNVAPNAGGAAGGMAGVGDSVTAADFDGDGFLDLFVATGGSMGRSEGPPSESGTYQLYRNVRNSNHWIEIDLEGTSSNRDGIGARVFVTAGGVTQVRIQDGGVHNRGQNSQRLHFGLAKHTQIEKILIYWPSGKIQELSKVAANQIVRIKEPLKTSPGNLPATSK